MKPNRGVPEVEHAAMTYLQPMVFVPRLKKVNLMQRLLFDQPPRKPKAEPSPPHSGSETSKAAAELIRPNAETLRARVLEYIEAQGQFGATDSEIQSALVMEGNTERPRRQELQTQGLIRDSGQTRATASGRQAVVWIATNHKNRS